MKFYIVAFLSLAFSFSADAGETRKERREERREEMKQAASEIKEACMADAKKFCNAIPPGRGRVMSCLKARSSELSEACATEISHKKEMRRGKRK